MATERVRRGDNGGSDDDNDEHSIGERDSVVMRFIRSLRCCYSDGNLSASGTATTRFISTFSIRYNLHKLGFLMNNGARSPRKARLRPSSLHMNRTTTTTSSLHQKGTTY